MGFHRTYSAIVPALTGAACTGDARSRWICACSTLLALRRCGRPRRADITAFIGANTTPANRQVRGVALGFGLLIVGFEFEYAYTPDDPIARRRRR